MDMKNINVFRRLDELETANLHLQVMLKSARHEIECLKALMRLQVKAVKPGLKAVKTTDALESTRAKKAAYARTYYAKKRAAAKAAA